MTKKELIDHLADLDDDAEIYMNNPDGEMAPVSEVIIYRADAPAFALLETLDENRFR